MKTFTLGFVVGILVAVIGYTVQGSISRKERIPNDYARVTIRNESGKTVSTLKLNHHEGTLTGSSLRDKEEFRFIFRNSGENEYKILVTFSDSTTLESKEMYFENGYRSIETIKSESIETKTNWYEAASD